MEKYDALIFDIDGTLWDAAHVSAHGWNLALVEMGLSPRVTADDIRSVSGNPFARCVEILLPQLHPAPASLLKSLERQERLAFDTVAAELYEGVAEGIPRLAEAYPLFVVSNCPDWYLEKFVNATGFGRHLTGRDCHGLSGVSKREMLEAMRRTHRLDQAVYVGDTQGDRDAAEAAGLDFAFVRYGFGTLEGPAVGGSPWAAPLRCDGACRSFDSFSLLVEHFMAARAG